VTYPNAKVVGLAKSFIPVKLDVGVSAAEKVAVKYKVEGTPTILFLDSKGKEVNRLVGYIEPAEFAKEMQSALKKAKG
jgi:Thioredoxin-related protein